MILSLVAGLSLVGREMTLLFTSNEFLIPSNLEEEKLFEYFQDVYNQPNKQKLFLNCMLNERKTKPRKRWAFSVFSCVLSVDKQVSDAFEEN